MVVTSVVGESKPIRPISKTEAEQNPIAFLFILMFSLPGNDEDNKIELNYLLKQDKRKQMAASYKHWQSQRKSIAKAFKPVTQQSSPLYTFTAGSIPQFVIKWKKLIKISSVHRTSLNVGSTGALSAYTTRLHV